MVEVTTEKDESEGVRVLIKSLKTLKENDESLESTNKSV
jgi:hypothetical protein